VKATSHLQHPAILLSEKDIEAIDIGLRHTPCCFKESATYEKNAVKKAHKIFDNKYITHLKPTR